jgi:hypothetical protein
VIYESHVDIKFIFFENFVYAAAHSYCTKFLLHFRSFTSTYGAVSFQRLRKTRSVQYRFYNLPCLNSYFWTNVKMVKK